MADMLLRGSRKTWGNCTCKHCIMGSRRMMRRANRPKDKRAWRKDVERGDNHG